MPRCDNCGYLGYRDDMWQCMEGDEDCRDWICLGYGGSDDINCFIHYSSPGSTCADCCDEATCNFCNKD